MRKNRKRNPSWTSVQNGRIMETREKSDKPEKNIPPKYVITFFLGGWGVEYSKNVLP